MPRVSMDFTRHDMTPERYCLSVWPKGGEGTSYVEAMIWLERDEAEHLQRIIETALASSTQGA